MHAGSSSLISGVEDEVLVSCRAMIRRHGTPGEIRAECAVRRGDRIAITGRSGSGKSMLMRLLAGLEPPTSGSVVWPGPPEPSRGGFFSESPNLHMDLSVRENVALAAIRMGVAEDEAFERAVDSLDVVGIADMADQLPHILSDGQVHRVAVARALAAGPSLLLADEPTARLGQATADEVISLLLGAADVLGAGLIVATCDDAVAARLPQHWSMSDGRLALSPSALAMGNVDHP